MLPDLAPLAHELDVQLTGMPPVKRAESSVFVQDVLQQMLTAASHALHDPLREAIVLLDGDADEAAGHVRLVVERMRVMREYLWLAQNPDSVAHVSLDDILRKAKLALGELIEASGVQIYAPELPAMLGSERQLQLMLEQLISNAIYYNDSVQPRIDIHWQSQAQMGYLTLVDNGIGIAPEVLQLAFSLFMRLHDDAQMHPQGMGCGLALARLVARNHGGDIVAQSIPGEGTRMAVSLRLA